MDKSEFAMFNYSSKIDALITVSTSQRFSGSNVRTIMLVNIIYIYIYMYIYIYIYDQIKDVKYSYFSTGPGRKWMIEQI